ncbi:MAG TPA: 4a-hydroxytetrahydrobiopterin dehydratase [Gemmatimonadaceae bacterium]|nr:4a-hydroxytetrahydrobiopterin dehydratase [Gemmatimonadaceae bacterium]
MPLLSDIEVQRELATLAGWARKRDEIVKTFAFKGFPDAIDFVQKLVAPAEAMNHHPDLDIRYNKVTVRLSTHDKGGITEKDIELARKAESMAG